MICRYRFPERDESGCIICKTFISFGRSRVSLFERQRSTFWQTDILTEGHQVVRSTGKRSRREAAQFERELNEPMRRELTTRRNANKPLTIMTLDAACAQYWLEHGSRPADHRNIKWYLLYDCRHIDDQLWICDFSNKHISTFITSMRSAGIGERAINHTIVCLQGVHNRAGKGLGRTESCHLLDPPQIA